MLSHMKNTAVLINISRGAVVDEDALTAALSEKKLYGAVLDVFESEPLSQDSPLWDMENVVITRTIHLFRRKIRSGCFP